VVAAAGTGDLLAVVRLTARGSFASAGRQDKVCFESKTQADGGRLTTLARLFLAPVQQTDRLLSRSASNLVKLDLKPVDMKSGITKRAGLRASRRPLGNLHHHHHHHECAQKYLKPTMKQQQQTLRN
jgi:hypothetical protein